MHVYVCVYPAINHCSYFHNHLFFSLHLFIYTCGVDVSYACVYTCVCMCEVCVCIYITIHILLRF